VIVSKDEDFTDIVVRLGPPPQVLWVTCGKVTNRALRTVLGESLQSALELLQNGEPIVEIGRGARTALARAEPRHGRGARADRE
jgi:predicted nuclease of predicted toxin-antitoxin system